MMIILIFSLISDSYRFEIMHRFEGSIERKREKSFWLDEFKRQVCMKTILITGDFQINLLLQVNAFRLS